MENNISVQPTLEPSEDFIASFETTRTSLDGTAVIWHKNDQISIFTKTAHNRQYKIKEISEDGRTATFNYVAYTGSNSSKIERNYAIYPFDSQATIDNGIITTYYNPSQQYNCNSGEIGYALMAAKSDDNKFAFKNAGGLFRFTINTILPDTFNLQSITVRSAEKMIAGEVTIDLNNDDYKAFVTPNGTHELSLTQINSQINTIAKTFYIAMPETAFGHNECSVTFSFDEGDKVFTLPAFELKQNNIKTIAYTIKDAEEFIGTTPSYDEEIFDESGRTPQNNEIWYTATEKIEPNGIYEWGIDTFGTSVVSHNWNPVTGVGIIACDSNVTTISNSAFANCDPIYSVTIPETVTTMHNEPFANCENLEKIYISNIEMWYNLEFGSRANPLFNVADLYVNNELFTEWIVPDYMTTVPNIFLGCSSLKNIVIHSNITTLKDRAFYMCDNIENVYIDSLEMWYNLNRENDTASPLLCGANLYVAGELFTEWYVPEGQPDVRHYFNGCSSLERVHIHNNASHVGTSAFFCCTNLNYVDLGNSISAIDDWAFYSCKNLVEVNIPNSVQIIRTAVFQECTNLQRVTLGNGLLEAYDGSFSSCSSLHSVDFGNSIEKIGIEAFAGCTTLSTITLPESLTEIRLRAFNDCHNLTSVYCKATVPPTAVMYDEAWEAFSNNGEDRRIYVPADAVETYRTAIGWSDYAESIIGYDFEKNEVVEE